MGLSDNKVFVEQLIDRQFPSLSIVPLSLKVCNLKTNYYVDKFIHHYTEPKFAVKLGVYDENRCNFRLKLS